MDIRACPKCGETDLSKGSWSDGYDRGWSKSCSCGWSYTSKTLGSSGEHPRNFKRWCGDCETVFETVDKKNEHICTVREFVENQDEPSKIQEMIDSLLEYQSTKLPIRKDFISEVKAGRVEVYPMYIFKVREAANEPELDNLLLETIEDLGGSVNMSEVIGSLDAEHEFAKKAIHERLRRLERRGELRFSVDGLELTD